jgi:dipeptidyl aminopeptidase/acylaminoacyl peptidase
VSPANPDLVAFAGQAPNLAQTYDQNWNQIWIQNGSDPHQSLALQIDGILGRAPWWSPNGQYIAFESVLTPTDGYNPFYRIWILGKFDPPSVGTMQMVTPADLPVQHAKWSPSGTLIVFAYVIASVKPRSTPQGPMAPQGIAIVEVPPSIPGA